MENNPNPLPKRTTLTVLEKESVLNLHRHFSLELFEIRAETATDAGVDVTIELAGDVFTNQRVNVQLKATKCEELNSDGSISKSIESKNLNYLHQSPLLGLYIFYVKETEKYYYEWVDEFERHLSFTTGNWRKQETNTLRFRKTLDTDAVKEISQRIERHAVNLQRMKDGLKIEGLIESFHEPEDQRNYDDISWSLNKLIDTFDGLPVLPKNIITKFPPFTRSKESGSFYSDYNHTLYTDNPKLFAFFKGLKVVDNQVHAENGEVEDQHLVKKILTFFEYNSIAHLAMAEDRLRHDRICIHNLYITQHCDCEKCSYSRLQWGNVIAKLKTDFNKEETFEWLRRAYILLELGKVKEAFLLYKELAAYSYEKKKYVSYVISKYNLVSMAYLLRTQHSVKDREEMETEVLSIDLRSEIFNLANRPEVKQEIFLILSWFTERDYLHEMYVEIDMQHAEILKVRHADQRGLVVNQQHYLKMAGLLSEMTVYSEGNVFHSTYFNGFRIMMQKGIESALILNTIRNPLSRKLESFDNYICRLCLLYADPADLNKLFGIYKAHPIVFQSRHEEEGRSVFRYIDNLLGAYKEAEAFCKAESDNGNDRAGNQWNRHLHIAALLISVLDATDADINRNTLNLIYSFSSSVQVEPEPMSGLREIFQRKSKNLSITTYQECYRWLITSRNRDFDRLTIEIPYLLKEVSPEYIDQDEAVQNSISERLEKQESDHRSDYHVILAYAQIAGPTLREKINAYIQQLLTKSFDANLYFRAAVNSLIDYNQYLDVFIKDIPLSKNDIEVKRFFGEYDDVRNVKLNDLIKLSFKFGIDMEAEEIQKLHGNVPYYQWLLNLGSFDYANFDAYWVLYDPNEIFIAEFKKYPEIKKAVRKYLEHTSIPRLNEIYVQFLSD